MAKQSEIKNHAASVKARLFNYARDNGKDFQGVFRLYVQERFLYRLSRSAYAKKFILKGALLFLAFDISKYRPTKDIDFLGTSVENDEDVAVESLKEYLKSRKGRNISKLLEYSEICGVRKKIEPLAKVILS